MAQRFLGIPAYAEAYMRSRISPRHTLFVIIPYEERVVRQALDTFLGDVLDILRYVEADMDAETYFVI